MGSPGESRRLRETAGVGRSALNGGAGARGLTRARAQRALRKCAEYAAAYSAAGKEHLCMRPRALNVGKGAVESAGGVRTSEPPDSRYFFSRAVAYPSAPLCALHPIQLPMIRMIAGPPALPAGGLAAKLPEATPPKNTRLQL